MRNRDKSAHPAPSDAPDGLTKREAAAIAAMQGMLANPTCGSDFRCAQAGCKKGMRDADALFDELDEGRRR